MKKLALITSLTIFLAALVGGLYLWLSQPGSLYQGRVLGVHETGSAVGSARITPTPTPYSSNFNIYLPSLDINAPVFENVDGSKVEEYLPNVLSGVAHYKHKRLPDVTVDGALPGEIGNIFLFGHSQIPGGDTSNFKGVFNDLPQIKVGERVVITYRGQIYEYEVTSAKKNVGKDEIHYLERTPEETLTIMTCWPLGLDVRRFVVRAKRVG